MTPLNYQHLLYFWTVAREGSVTKASEVLHLTQPAVSAQLRTLERALGQRLLERRGRGLVLTEIGRLAYQYADEIFGLGRELTETLAGRVEGRVARFVVGVVDAMPKLVVHRLLTPALRLDPPVRVILREGRPEELLAGLATHALDLVLTDALPPAGQRVRVFTHLLGECGVGLFAAPQLAARHRRGFPQSLAGAPFLLPGENAAIRRPLEQWLEEQAVHVTVRAEVGDSAVLKVFGQAGEGVFAAPLVIQEAVQRQYGVELLGHADTVRERFYALTVERRIVHPAALAITRTAREELFAPRASGARKRSARPRRTPTPHR